MAVIRANRLWTKTLAARALEKESVVGVPDYPGSGDPKDPKAGWQDVYTVPAGKRAILRTATFQIGQPPGGAEPTVSVILFPASGQAVSVFWYWFVEHSLELATWRLWTQWSPMLTLYAGDRLQVFNGAPTSMDSMGSGHLLNEPQ